MEIKIDSSKSLNTPSDLFGLFFEDINHSLDGGLNANLVQNGWFDYCFFQYFADHNAKFVRDCLKAWNIKGQGVTITKDKPISKNRPYSLKIDSNEDVEFLNLGYELDSGKQFLCLNDDEFVGEFYYISDLNSEIFVELKGQLSSLDKVKIALPKTNQYKKVEYKLKGKRGERATLCFTAKGQTKAQFVGFRLLPSNTFEGKNKYSYGKFNKELAEFLGKMNSKFLRFPGGCLVEGDLSTDYLYEWEKTIGALSDRVSKPSVWQYCQTNEIGFYEYLCLCEDLKLKPIPVHHVGLICQIRTEIDRHLQPIAFEPKSKDFKEKVIDSIAHLIYFAAGDVDSADEVERNYARIRAQMGHKKPFKLEYLALGNENRGDVYFRNFEAALVGIKNYKHEGKTVDLVKKFNITILSSAGFDINPQDTNPSWKYLNATHNELMVDEHVYNSPEWFIDNYYRYNFYNPNLSKVFMGEYACHTNANGLGWLGGEPCFKAALCEAVFMLGMENNPQIVKLSCYAPLLNKLGQSNWNPNLIDFSLDKNEVLPHSSTVVQALFAKFHGKKLAKLLYDIDKSNAGTIEADSNCKIALCGLDGKPIKYDKTREYQNCIISVSANPSKRFTLSLGTIRDGEQVRECYRLIYEPQDKALFYEKLAGGKRMTFEFLGDLDFNEKIEIKYTNDELTLKSDKDCQLSKKIWRVNQTIFANLTFDNDKSYLKIVNIADKDEKISFELADKVLKDKSSVKKIEFYEEQEGKVRLKQTSNLKLVKTLSVHAKSITVVVFEKQM